MRYRNDEASLGSSWKAIQRWLANFWDASFQTFSSLRGMFTWIANQPLHVRGGNIKMRFKMMSQFVLMIFLLYCGVCKKNDSILLRRPSNTFHAVYFLLPDIIMKCWWLPENVPKLFGARRWPSPSHTKHIRIFRWAAWVCRFVSFHSIYHVGYWLRRFTRWSKKTLSQVECQT